ncbi:MAG: hypothetical protein ACLFTW_12505 [Chitinispirillaceae bacterium]
MSDCKGKILSIRNLLLTVAAFNFLLGFVFQAFSTGLAGEYLLTRRWRDYYSDESPLTNPSFIAQREHLAFNAANCFTMNNAFRHTEFGVVFPVPSYDFRNALALTYVGEGSGNFEERVFSRNGETVSTGRDIGHGKHSFSLTYAANLYKGLDLGMNLNAASHSNFGYRINDGGVDLGLSYTSEIWELGTHTFGVSAGNIPGMAGKSRYDIPLYAPHLMFTWHFNRDIGKWFSINGGIEVAENNVTADISAKPILNSDRERKISCRLGADFLEYFSALFTGGAEYWGVALGIRAPFGEGAEKSTVSPRSARISYQFMVTEGNVAPSQTVYASGNLTSKQRLMERLWSMVPGNLYNEGRKLFSNGHYWQAMMKFSELNTHFPEFHLKAQSMLFLGKCKKELGLYETALKDLRSAKAECAANESCTESRLASRADLDISEIYYKNKQLFELHEQVESLFMPGVDDSFRFSASYLLGESFFIQRVYDSAIVHLSRIPPEHEDFLFAQYTKGVAHYLRGDNPEKYMKCFGECLEKGKYRYGADDDLIKDRVRVWLAQYYYEKDMLSRASRLLKAVRSQSPYFESALVTYTWCAWKARKWGRVRETAKLLGKVTKSRVRRYEAVVMEAAALMQEKRYEKARQMLEKIEAGVDSLEKTKQTAIEKQEARIRESRRSYEKNIGSSVEKTFGAFIEDKYPMKKAGPQDTLVFKKERHGAVVDSLHFVQREMRSEIMENTRLLDRMKERAGMEDRIEFMKMEVPMILTRAIEMSIAQQVQEGDDSSKESTEKLDERIDSLKEQLERLEGQQ